MLEYILPYIETNKVKLFKTDPINSDLAIFDNKGFKLSDQADSILNELDPLTNERFYSLPHLYIAFMEEKLDEPNHIYVGKSCPPNAILQRAYNYPNGTLVYNLTKSIRPDDLNHVHWLDAWMEMESLKRGEINTIKQKSPIYICFIPFQVYAALDFRILSDNQIRAFNRDRELVLIQYFKSLSHRPYILNIYN